MPQRSTEPRLARYLHRKGSRLGLPISGNFELTARCNFDCPMCYVHLKQEDVDAAGRELTAKEWIDIARAATDQGMVFVLLTGGEPFVRKDFFEIYDAMKAMGLIISINTNGSMLSGALLDRLLEDPPFRVNISLYGGSNETYRTMCAQSAFDRVVEAIRALKTAGVDVRINLSITPYNRQDIDRIHAICQELQVHVKATSYMYPSIRVNGGQYGCGNRLTPEEAAQCAVQWDKLRCTPAEFDLRARSMHDMTLSEPRECSADLDQGIGCRAGRSSFWMAWDGRMLPCGMMPAPAAYPLREGFQSAWQQLRAETAAIRLPAKCAGCPKREMCWVCAAVCITETGTFDQVPEYLCRQVDETIRLSWQAYCEGKAEHHED